MSEIELNIEQRLAESILPELQELNPPEAAPAEPESALPPADSTPVEESGQEPPLSPPAQTPAEETPEVPPEITSILEQVKEEDRGKVLDALVKSLPRAERAKLPAVSEILTEVANTTAQRVREQDTRTAEQRKSWDEQVNAASSLKDRLRPIVGDQLDVNNEVETVASVAAEYRETLIVQDMQSNLSNVLRRVGIEKLPEDFVKNVQEAKSIGEQLGHYAMLIASKGYQDGLAKAKGESSATTEANAIVAKARMKNEILGELAKEGRIKIEGDVAQIVPDKVPPLIAGQTQSGVSGMTLDKIEAIPTHEWLAKPKEERERLLTEARSRA